MREQLTIDDVLGLKLIGDAEVVDRLQAWATESEDFEVLECEEHQGRYRATHVALSWRLPLHELAGAPLGEEITSVMRARGLRGDLDASFRRFVRDAEETVVFEVIIQDYDEALDSELGRTMHEERVIRQRASRGYHIDVARNITLLMKFLFYFALSRRENLNGIPVKLWVRYMPDTADQVLFSLTDFPAGAIGLQP